MTNSLAEGVIEFHFVKSRLFRVIHVDGAVGSVSNTFIHMSLFSERAPVPRKTVHAIHGGIVGREILEKRDVRAGAFREVEVDLVFNLETAFELRAWLDEKIKDAQELQLQALAAPHVESQK